MAIAQNFLKFPQALALQLPLPLGRPAWNTSRPTTRQGRAVRAFISRAVKVAAALPFAARLELAGAVKKVIPQWARDFRHRAQALARVVKDRRMCLDFSESRFLT
ncbi:hypothetical protein ACFO3A_04155 [Comamonas nitrativorans]|uniref:Uncharacterized protein n=1 Tax=Comamonas nitrativorans TaxID=108437 RepID=A0ABV9GVN8_9BURK